ncbi:MAG TPA: hypothetical protein PLN54_16325, partial [Flavobacteriales bacterium]|nr:hypothetical protein [Flavobacteriales bacterium]
GIEAPAPVAGTQVELRFDLHCQGEPFHPDSLYTDGFGTLVRFEQVRFALVGALLLNEEGGTLGEAHGSMLWMDLAQPGRTLTVDAASSGEVHWMDTRLLSTSDPVAEVPDSLWVTGPNGRFLPVLELRGKLDSNDDGQVDASDGHFRIAVAPEHLPPLMRLHAHTVLPAGGTAVLELPVNLTALLHGIDLPDEPQTIGQGPYATQALQNLRTRVLGADNKPM